MKSRSAKEPQESPNKFTRIYKCDDGITLTWYYDFSKTSSGPYRVEVTYPKDWNDPSKKKKEKKKRIKK